MKLKLRCCLCDKVKESEQDTDELENAEADDVRPDIFICADCLAEMY